MGPNSCELPGPTACLVVGVAGSGKSLLARELVECLANGTYISKDMVQSPFTSERLIGEEYARVSGPTYRFLVDFVAMQLSLAKIPFVDAPFSINHWRRDAYSDWIPPFRKATKQHGARLAVIRCLPPSLDSLRERIAARGYPWDRWKLENWDEFLSREPTDFPIAHDDLCEVVTNRPTAELAEELLHEYLSAEAR
jgi:predicted kinase